MLVRARELWLVGTSQVEECDPVFEHLSQSEALTMRDYRLRYELAIEEREFSLARWLAKSIDAIHVDERCSKTGSHSSITMIRKPAIKCRDCRWSMRSSG